MDDELHRINVLDRMVRALEKVRERLARAVFALESYRLDYALAGDNAVAAWMAQVDDSAARNTPDVDIVIRREDLATARQALASEGFFNCPSEQPVVLIDGTEGKRRDAVQLFLANEKIQSDDRLLVPDPSQSVRIGARRVLDLVSLTQMKLTAFRAKDRVNLRDLLSVGLIDATWLPRLPSNLALRLQQILDDPEG